MKYNLKLNEEIQIMDPVLAQKWNEAQRQINDRLKKIAQLEKEIVTYKQQSTAAQAQAMKDNQAVITKHQETQAKQQPPNSNTQPVKQPFVQQPVVQENLESYIMEDNEEDEELEYSEEYDEKVGDEDEFLFYFKIDEVSDTVYKAYKDFDEDRWELTVVEGESNQSLEETTFESNFTKLEIINYLAEIYGDVEEIFEDEFDDKTKTDKEYFNETIIPNKYFNIK